MPLFNFNDEERKVNSILHSKTEIKPLDTIPNDESQFTYENGVRTWVGALFVDIRDSTNYFKNNKEEIIARIMRAFCNEVIYILNQNDNYREIGIRGDCVFAIYSVPMKEDISTILDDAAMIVSFNKMFQDILKDNSMPTFKIGIGLGASNDLVIKAGKKGTGINDYIWIGDSVINASKLSNQGNKDGFDEIVMDSCFYSNIKDFNMNKAKKYSDVFNMKYSYNLRENVYHGLIYYTDVDDWRKNHYGR